MFSRIVKIYSNSKIIKNQAKNTYNNLKGYLNFIAHISNILKDETKQLLIPLDKLRNMKKGKS